MASSESPEYLSTPPRIPKPLSRRSRCRNASFSPLNSLSHLAKQGTMIASSSISGGGFTPARGMGVALTPLEDTERLGAV
jgi:hypothetical protein